MKDYPIYINEHWHLLNQEVAKCNSSQVFVIVDENTRTCCLPIFKKEVNFSFQVIEVVSGEKNKNLDTCQSIWSTMIEKSADRKCLVINLGGGVIGDMGGFSASTYKRGVSFIHIPTTLLSMVDSSIGGKLGVDFQGLKNSIGQFNSPSCVFIHTPFLKTLDNRNIRSGLAEIIKHGLIADRDYWLKLKATKGIFDDLDWPSIIKESIEIKKSIVVQDPLEKGIRKTLNFGHTIGHAIESYSLTTTDPLLHGEAIAIGMKLEARLSAAIGFISHDESDEIETFLDLLFPPVNMNVDQSKMMAFILNDKKNEHQTIKMALLNQIGKANYDIEISESQILNVIAEL